MEEVKTWRCKNAVLGTYEIENTIWKSTYLNYVDRYFSYVDTSICYNNDLYLKKLLKNKYIKVISKIPPQMFDHYDFMIENHLRCLGRKHIDIMLIHNPRSEQWKELAVKMLADERLKEIGVSNFNIDQLIEYKQLMGSYPAYNEMEINPNYYDKSLIEFCHVNNIKIIAYAILGGKYNARRNIATYTLPYLLEFAGRNAEYVIVRSDDYNRLEDMRFHLESHNALDPQYKDSIFDIEPSTSKSINPTSYSSPKFYTRSAFPTNSDHVVRYKAFNLCKGFVYEETDETTIGGDKLKIKDKFLEGAIEKYEFVSDLRVMARYQLDNYMHDIYNKWPVGEYLHPSTYTARIMKKRFLMPDKMAVFNYVSLCLLNEDTGHLSKVNDGKCKLIIDSK